MKPYYEQDGITIYNGDCREILPTLPKVDLVLTDPPYGLGGRMSGGTWGATPEYRDMKKWDKLVDGKFLWKLILHGTNAIVWGGNYYALPPCRGFLAWVKSNAVPTMADLEIAWTTFDRPAKAWATSVHPDGRRLHPTQKPIQLFLWCLEQAKNAETILDPFMGAGTTLRAAKDLGRRAIGIETEEKYCEIAVKRLAQGVLDFGGE